MDKYVKTILATELDLNHKRGMTCLMINVIEKTEKKKKKITIYKPKN